MIPAYKAAGASTAPATIVAAGPGGFTAIASTGDVDRDGEVIRPGCFDPLPASVPVHVDHGLKAADVIGRAKPYYLGDKLMVEVRFASTPDAQTIREKVTDGVLDSISIVFSGRQWQTIDGVRTCTAGELLAADVVSVPSNRGARILSARSWQTPSLGAARACSADAILEIARVEIAAAKALLAQTDTRDVSQVITTADIRRFTRSLRP